MLAALLKGIKSAVIKQTKTWYPSLENSNVSTDKMFADMKVKQNELMEESYDLSATFEIIIESMF